MKLARRCSSLAASDDALHSAIRALDDAVLADSDAVHAAEAAAVAMANACEDEVDLASRRSWASWLNDGPAGGLGRQHRFTRVPTGWVPTKAAHGPVIPLSGWDEQDKLTSADLRRLILPPRGGPSPLNAQQAVEVEANGWAVEWAEGQPVLAPLWPVDLLEPLPRPTVQMLRAAMRSFPAGTGLGWDAVHPRAYLRLSDSVLEALIDIFMRAEATGRWPAGIGLVVVALLPKGDGGFRPIGLFPSLIRIWMRMRRDLAQKWEREHARDYFYAGEAKGAQVAAWQQAFRAEAAAQLDATYVQVLMDMVKAFERVPPAVLAREAAATGFPLQMLRLSVASYSLPRVVGIGGVFSRRIAPRRGITAGSAFATTELRCMLMRTLDAVVKLHPHASLSVYVDDIVMETTSTARRAASTIIAASLMLCSRIEGDLGMAISTTKSCCTSSSPAAGREVAAALAHFCIAFSLRVKSLGVGLGAGVRRCTKFLQARLHAFKARGRRFRRLRFAGASAAKVARTGATASIDYGIAVCGVSSAALLARRRAVAAAIGSEAAGRSLDLDLLLADGPSEGYVDPAFEAHAAPLAMWAEASWMQWAPRHALNTTMAKVKLKLLHASRPWARVTGPAAAVVATAARLGWHVADATTLVTDRGRRLDLTCDPPTVVRREVRAAVDRWRWRRIELGVPGIDSGGAGHGAAIAPVRRLLRPAARSPSWTPACQAALRSGVIASQWPQARLHAAKLADDPHCQRCAAGGVVREGQPDVVMAEPPRGTAWHRSVHCPPNRAECERRFPDVAADMADAWRTAARDEGIAGTAAAHARTAKWTRALVPSPAPLVPPPGARRHVLLGRAAACRWIARRQVLHRWFPPRRAVAVVGAPRLELRCRRRRRHGPCRSVRCHATVAHLHWWRGGVGAPHGRQMRVSGVRVQV